MKRSSTDNGDANDGEALSQGQTGGASGVPSWSDFMKSIGEEELESEDATARPKKLVVGSVALSAEQKERMRKANEAKEKRHQELRLKRLQARQAAMQSEEAVPVITTTAPQPLDSERMENKEDSNSTAAGNETTGKEDKMEVTAGETKKLDANLNVNVTAVQTTAKGATTAVVQGTLVPKTPRSATTVPATQLTTQLNTQRNAQITVQGPTQGTALIPTQVSTQGAIAQLASAPQQPLEPKSKPMEQPKAKEGGTGTSTEVKTNPGSHVEVIIQSAYALEKENLELKNKVTTLEQKLKHLNIEISRLRNTNQIITKQNAELLEYSERLLQQAADSLKPS